MSSQAGQIWLGEALGATLGETLGESLGTHQIQVEPNMVLVVAHLQVCQSLKPDAATAIAEDLKFDTLKQRFPDQTDKNKPELVQRKYIQHWIANCLCHAKQLKDCKDGIARLAREVLQFMAQYDSQLVTELRWCLIIAEPPAITLDAEEMQAVSKACHLLGAKDDARGTLCQSFHDFPVMGSQVLEAVLAVKEECDKAQAWVQQVNGSIEKLHTVLAASTFSTAMDLLLAATDFFHSGSQADIRATFVEKLPALAESRADAEEVAVWHVLELAQTEWFVLLIDLASEVSWDEDRRTQCLAAYRDLDRFIQKLRSQDPDVWEQSLSRVGRFAAWAELNMDLSFAHLEDVAVHKAKRIAELLEDLHAQDLVLRADKHFQGPQAGDLDKVQCWCRDVALPATLKVLAIAVDEPMKIVRGAFDMCSALVLCTPQTEDQDTDRDILEQVKEVALEVVRVSQQSSPRRF